jgi:hypothetical protein
MMSNVPIASAHDECLALFAPPAANAGVEHVEEVVYRPTSQLTTHNSCVDFYIPPSPKYIRLDSVSVAVQLQIVTRDGTPVGKGENVTLTNHPIASLFNNLEVRLNGVDCNKFPAPFYSYKSYLDTLTGYGEEAKKSWCEAMMFAQEERDMDNPRLYAKDPADEHEKARLSSNAALAWRNEHTMGGKVCEIEGRLNADIFKCKRYMIGSVGLAIRLWQSRDQFRLMAEDLEGKGYTIRFVDCSLKVEMVTVAPELAIAHEAMLEKHDALYPFEMSDYKVYTIGKSDLTVCVDNLFNGRVPKTVTCVLVSSDAMNGDYGLSPYNFQHFDVNYVNLSVDGVPIPSSRPWNLDFNQDQYVEAFVNLYKTTGQFGRDAGSNMGLHAYKRGNTVFGFPVAAKSGLASLVREGHVRLEMKFAKPLPSAVSMIVIGKFDAVLSVKKSRLVQISTP